MIGVHAEKISILVRATHLRIHGPALILILALMCGTVAAAEEIAPGTLSLGVINHTGIVWRSAQIDGDRIIWAESISKPRFLFNVYLYNITIGKETLISPLSADDPHNEFIDGERPVSISGNHIAWIKNENVWVHDRATGTSRPVTANSDDFHAAVLRWDPAISGDVVVWREENWTRLQHMPRIMAHNLTTGVTTAVVVGDWDKNHLGIAGSRIVWEDSRKDKTDRDIWLYDLSTGEEHVVCSASGTQFDPKISGDRIVWSDNRNGNRDIYLYDIRSGTETAIATGIAEQEGAAISGDRIIWMEYPSTLLNNPYDESNRLMLYDLSSGKEYEILHDIPDMFAQEISGNRIVFMDLAHIPAGERETLHENTLQEISIFSLDPAIFPGPAPVTTPENITTISSSRSSDIPRPVTSPLPEQAPGFGVFCFLSVVLMGILCTMVRKG